MSVYIYIYENQFSLSESLFMSTEKKNIILRDTKLKRKRKLRFD
jgi:hypothetical protein